ncbi:MAG: hypothetical protein OXT09_08950 [Myxococcales bacterium]|nr:hypothetical protein [Myxococcales bacterium]
MRAFALTAQLLLVATAGVGGRASAQEVLHELPARAGALFEDNPRDRTAALRVGAQAELDESQRMPFSPSAALRYRAGAPPDGGEAMTSALQLGVSLQAPTHGSARAAALRSLTLGPALALEPSICGDYRPTDVVLLYARPWLRLEWQLAALDRADTDRLERIAPLVGAVGLQAGVGLGPWLNTAELSVAHRLIAGGAPAEYLSEVERFPRLSLGTALLLTSHLQLFLRVLPRDGLFSTRAAWSAGLALSMAWSLRT